jgi:hypothetical protein
MAYGESKARAARFNNRQSATGASDIIQRGLAAEEELYGGGGPQVPQLPEGMQIISGVTQDVQKQWAAVEDFANQMWANYRINVTRPDTRNPMAVKAHDLYQQAIAGLQYAGDVLKQSNATLAEDRKAVREGRGMILQDPTQNIYGYDTPEDTRFVNTELDPLAQQANAAYAKSYDTKSATQAAQKAITGQEQAAVSRLQQMGAPNRAAIVQQQFQGPVYEQPQFNPNTGSRKPPVNPKPIYDQLTNYRIGILNNDPGVLGSIKSTFPGVLDVRPVNREGKQGAFITRKAGDKTVTSFIDLSANDPTQGIEPLFYLLNDANPSKFQVNPNDFVPYMQGAQFQNFTPPQTTPEVNEMNMIFKNLNTKSDSEVTLGNGQTIVFDKDTKKGMIDRLDKLAIAGDLKMPDGEPIINVEWRDAKGWGTGEVLVIETPSSPEDEPIVFDPNDPEDQRRFGDIIDANSSILVSPEAWQKSKTPYVNTGEIKPGEEGRTGTVNADTQSQARSIVEMYEKSKQNKK